MPLNTNKPIPLRVFGLLSSSLLLFPQRFGRYVLWPSSGGFNKGRSSMFHIGSRVRQTPEEGQRTYRLKRCGNNNKDEDNSLKTLNDKIIKFCLRNLDNETKINYVYYVDISKNIKQILLMLQNFYVGFL